MIHAVRCNQPGFKDVTFRPGFNVVLAERSEEATKKDSRKNGLGKTTLIEIIHFCLGARATRNSRLMATPLKTGYFRLISICAANATSFPETLLMRGVFCWTAISRDGPFSRSFINQRAPWPSAIRSGPSFCDGLCSTCHARRMTASTIRRSVVSSNILRGRAGGVQRSFRA